MKFKSINLGRSIRDSIKNKIKKKDITHHEKENHKFFQKLQVFARALLFPVATLPLAAIFLRLGTFLADPTSGIINHASPGFESWYWYILYGMELLGHAVFDNLGIIFGVGLAFGLARKNAGQAALAALIAMFSFQFLLYFNYSFSTSTENISRSGSLALIFPWNANFFTTDSANKTLPSLSQLMNTGIIGGIIIGPVVAMLYNKYYQIQFHPLLAFFSGKRFIPIISTVFAIFLAFVFSLLWPAISYSIYLFGSWLGHISIQSANNSNLLSRAAVGAVAGFYAIINRLLLSVGLHNVLNVFVWFQNSI